MSQEEILVGTMPAQQTPTCLPDEIWDALSDCRTWFDATPERCKAGGVMSAEDTAACLENFQNMPNQFCADYAIGMQADPEAVEKSMALPSCSGRERPGAPEGLPWLWIGLGAAVVVGGAYLLLR